MTWNTDLAEAEIDKLYDRIEALERENARLRVALERIAAHCNLCDRYVVTGNKEQLRIAKEALA